MITNHLQLSRTTSITPNYLLNTSTPKTRGKLYTVYPKPFLGINKIGAMVNLFFNFSNEHSWASFQTNLIPFCVGRVIRAASLKKSSTNLWYYPAKPKKLQISNTFFGYSQLITDSILIESTLTPDADTARLWGNRRFICFR